MKRLMIMVVTLIMALFLIACNGGTAEEEEVLTEAGLPSAEEIIDGVTKALADTKSYQFNMDMTMDMSGEAEGEVLDISMDMGGSGAIDLNKQEMMMDMNMNMAMPSEEAMDMEMAMYMIEDTMYMQMTNPILVGPPMWMKFEVPEEEWAEMSSEIDQIQSLIDMLETGDVEVTGSTKIGNVDCYVVEIMPDVEQLWQMAMEQMQLPGQTGGLPEVTVENLPDILQSYSIKYWIAKDTYFITKMVMDMVMVITPEAMGYPEEEGEMNMDMKMSMLMYDYNQPVNINLPPEAEDAIDIPMMPEA